MTDRIKLLVVDDEPNLCALTKEFLEMSKNIMVDTVCSVKEAMDALNHQRYDAIISDYQMPVEDGLQFLSSIRKKGDTTPFILFTGKGREEVVIQALNLGADSYLQKGGQAGPQYAELENRVKNLVQRNRALEALHESEFEFRFLFEENPDAAFIMDVNGIVLKCNRASEQMLRLSKDEIVGRSLVDLNVFDAREMGRFQMILRTGGDITDFAPFAHQIRRKDGSVIWVESRTSRVMRGGKFHAMQIIARDITDLRLAEKKREEAFEQMRLKLDRVLSPDYAIEDGELSNIIDADELRSMMDNFYVLSGMVFAILDLKGKILVANGWQDICTKFHRANAASSRNCTESDLHLTHELAQGECRAYHCMNGMWDIVTPLFIGGRHWGNLYSGQFFYDDEVIDRDSFRAQAKRYGFDEIEYMAALDKVPRVSREKVANLMEFYSKFATKISQLGYSNLKLAKLLADYERTEVALRCSEERYRTYVEHSPVIFFVMDDLGRCLDVNKTTCTMLGRSRQEILGLSMNDITVEQDRPIIERNHMGVLEADHTPYEVRLLTNSGSTVPVLLKMIRLPDGNTMVIGIDISNRKDMEDALRESEALLRELVHAIPDLVWLKDRDGVYLHCNASFERFFGASEARIIGRTDHDFLDKELADFFRENDLRAIKNGGPTINEESIAYKSDGHRATLETIKTPMYDDHGSLIGVLGIAHDITKRRQMEQSLREANRKLSILSGITRHDINNQLTQLAGNLDMLENMTSGAQSDRYIYRAKGSIDRISAMIQFTKLYEDIGVKTPVWHDVKELIDKVAEDHRIDDVMIVNDIPSGIQVFADPLIVNMFHNLIDNSIRHGKRTTMVRFFMERNEGCDTIVCEDDGVGIQPEMKEVLFTRSFGSYHGLGLFLSHEILAITGISMEEKGEPGHGARFVMAIEPNSIRTG